MKNLILIFLILLLPAITFSQINYSIKGKIITADGYAPSGNVMLLQANDSTFLKGDFFLDGQFQLENVNHSAVLLHFTSLEFEDTFIQVAYTDIPLIDLGTIELQSSGLDLEEIVVKSRRPVYIQQKDGSMTVMIENTSLAASNSVQEILSKSPDVLVNEEGAITVFGKGTAIVYWNGKRISNEQLELIDPSTIKKIDIIRNPSAKYDADGAAVIRIVTIQSIQDGYQGTIKQNATYSDFAGLDTYSSMNVNIHKGKFSSTANYALLQGKDRHILYTTRNRDAADVFLQTEVTTEWKHHYDNYSYYGAGLQYDYQKDSYLSLQYAGYSKQLGGQQLSNNRIEDIESISFYESTIDRKEKYKNNNLSFNFNHTLDTLSSSFFLGGQYANFKINTNNPIFEQRIESDGNSSNQFQNKSDLDIDIFSLQTDFTKVYSNKNIIELGAKYSFVENGSRNQFLVVGADNQLSINEELSNQFTYQESVLAAYASVKGAFNESLSYSLGLRSEYTDYQLNLSQVQDQSIANQYLNLFPKISLYKQFSDQYTLNISYAASITRVPYQRLNPVLYYQDPYTSIQGNPASVPEKTHALDIASNFKKTTFKVGYNYTIDPFGGGAIRGKDPKSYILIRLNFDRQHEWYTSVSRTFETSWLTSANTFSLRYTNIIDTEFDFYDVGAKPTMYVYSNNRIPIGKLGHMELLFWYKGNDYEGLYHRHSSWSSSLTLEKSFFDNALTCRFIANDLFHSVRAAGTYSIGETDIYFHRHWNTNYFRASVQYNFGQLKKSGYKNKAIGETENNRAR